MSAEHNQRSPGISRDRIALPSVDRVSTSTAAATGATGTRPSSVALVLGGALSTHSGGAVAATLFPRAGVLGVVTLRLAVAALLLLVVCRPRLRGHSRSDLLVVAGFGVALAGMNTLIYEAIARIPLGIAITCEVLGPLVLSVLAARRASSWLWALLALAGVAALGYGDAVGLDPAGIALALGAGAMWAAYILLSARTGARFPKADGLALAMTVAAALTVPLGIAVAGSRLLDPVTLGLGAAVALMSSALPFSLEMAALRRMPASVFAVLTGLGPAVAAVAGFVLLGQALGVVQVAGIGLVVAAGIGAVLGGRPAHPMSRTAAAVPTIAGSSRNSEYSAPE